MAAISRTDAAPLIPEDVTREIFQGVVEQSGVLRFGRRLPDMRRGQQRLPVLETLVSASFVAGEQPDDTFGTGHKTTTSQAWANKYINAEEIAAVVPIHENVLDDADYDIWQQLLPRIVESFGAAIDGAVLFGTNAPTSWPDGVVGQAIAAGNSVADGTGSDLYDDILGDDGVYSLVEQDGYEVNGSLAAPGFRGRLRGLRDGTTGQPIFMRAQPDGQNLQTATRWELDGQPVNFLRNGAFDTTEAELISGDWNQLVYALRKDVTVKIFDTGVITNPSTGAIVHNLLEHDMVALRVTMRLGWELPNPVNRLAATRGGVIDGSDTVGRFPFAVLTPGS
jgi:HK97 family phage major capsid protein